MQRLTYCEVNTSPYAIIAPGLTEMWSDRIVALEINHADPWSSLAPILGMFGINLGIMEQDGQPMPFFATHAFRDALLFLEGLGIGNTGYGMGGRNHYNFSHHHHRVGWAAVHIDELPTIIAASHINAPDRRFLITPPESGQWGNRGVGAANNDPFNPDGMLWHIGAHVTDDVLSRILNMFDLISFDPQFHAITRYGIYAESPHFDMFNQVSTNISIPRFAWTGEPYDSAIHFLRGAFISMRDGVFFTGIVDDVTWPRAYIGGYDEINRFAASNEGRSLNLLPTRTDPTGAFAARIAQQSDTWEMLNSLATELVRVAASPFSGSPDFSLADIWEEYMRILYEIGLHDFIALYSQMPLR
jgi:hypothetical protein